MAICIPRPQTASGAFSGPPDWLGPAGSPQRDRLDDPRWTGALYQGFPASGGTSEQALFRAMTDTVGASSFLYLSWWVKVDGSLDTDADTGDHFYVGFRASAGGTAMVIKVVPFNSASNDIVNQPAETLTPPVPAVAGVGSLTTFTNTGAGGTWVAITPDPAWINANTRIWLDKTAQRYAVQMKVPLMPAAASITNAAGPNLGADFRMWYSMRVSPAMGLPTFYSWKDMQEPTGGGLGAEQFPDPNTWEQYSTGAAGCADGITVDYADIGTTNGSRVMLSPHINRFFARPKNATSATIAAQRIKARFRIANWGSMITYLDGHWDDIPGGASVTHTASYPSGTAVTPGQAPIPANSPINPNPTSTIWFDWTLDAAESAPFISGAKNPDQCMVVNLSGAGLTFTRDSACRNMQFDTNSISTHAAAIDIRGLTPVSPQPRDVYILVEKVNMPANTPAGYTEGQYLSTAINRVINAEDGDDSNSLGRRLRAAQQLLANANPAAISEARLAQIMAALRQQLVAFKTRDEALNKVLIEQLISSIDNWLSAVKPEANARKRLSVLFASWASWLRASAVGSAIGETATLLKDLTDWLSALNNDSASSKNLPRVGEAFQQWLANLADDGGPMSKLSVVVETVVAWLNSDRSPARLLAVLDALRQWLATPGKDTNVTRQNLAWLIQEVIDWLSPAKDRLAGLTGALETAGVTAAELENIFPTCRFHVYHDTGRRESRRDGQSVPILEAQVPFGYWLYHEDDVQGWTAILEGATRLAENFYVIKVPNNSAVNITTKIQAVEPGEERIPEPPIVTPNPDVAQGCRELLRKLFGGK